MLHIAASCGKWDVMEWLIEELGEELYIYIKNTIDVDYPLTYIGT